jgi:ArsR family transcriptional regulator, arsenate/arsenite/antimonite-responsive transcriptional repressor
VGMDTERAADAMYALGAPVRLGIYRMLVRAGSDGMTIGRIQRRTGIPRSTLSHHLHRLIGAGLVSSEKVGTSLVCRADYRAMDDLVAFLSDECCAEEGGRGDAVA